MKWLRKHQEPYAPYNPIERMNETLDGILAALETIAEHVEDAATQVEDMASDLAALRNEAVGEVVRYIHEKCPYCHSQIWGTKDDIDSGMRKHIEYCDEAQRELEHEQAESDAQMAHDEMIANEPYEP